MRIANRLACFALVGLIGPAALHAQTTPKPTIPPDKLILTLNADAATGKFVSTWNALPASYQKDVQGVVSEAAGKIDPEVFAKGVAVAKKAVKLLKDKKAFILKNEAFAKLPLKDPKKLPEFYDASLAVLDTLVNSELTRLDDLKKADIEKFLAGTGSTLFKQAGVADDLIDPTLPDLPVRGLVRGNAYWVKYPPTVTKSDDKEATVESRDVSFKPPHVTVINFVNADGKWLERGLVAEWPGMMKKAKEGVAIGTSKEAKAAALAFIDKLDKGLDALAAAKTEVDFNKELVQQLAPFLPAAPK